MIVPCPIFSLARPALVAQKLLLGANKILHAVRRHTVHSVVSRAARIVVRRPWLSTACYMATIAIGVIAPTPGRNSPQDHPVARSEQGVVPPLSLGGVMRWVEPPAFGSHARNSADPDLTMTIPIGVQQPPTGAQFLAPSVDLRWPIVIAPPVSIDLPQEEPASPQPVPEPSGLAVLAAAVCGVALVRWGPGA
jgi:hypothetical protein